MLNLDIIQSPEELKKIKEKLKYKRSMKILVSLLLISLIISLYSFYKVLQLNQLNKEITYGDEVYALITKDDDLFVIKGKVTGVNTTHYMIDNQWTVAKMFVSKKEITIEKRSSKDKQPENYKDVTFGVFFSFNLYIYQNAKKRINFIFNSLFNRNILYIGINPKKE